MTNQPPAWSRDWSAQRLRLPDRPIPVVRPEPLSPRGFSVLGTIAFVIGVLLAGFTIWAAYDIAIGYGPGSALSHVIPIIPESSGRTFT